MKVTHYSGLDIHEYDEVTSTNDIAKKYLYELPDSRDIGVVWAHSQSNGRGRRGRQWSSPIGNLYCSVYLWPRVPLTQASELSFVSAVALGRVLGKYLSSSYASLQYKWPNDILIKGSKVAGIILETNEVSRESYGLVIGMGANLLHKPENSLYSVSCLKDHLIDFTLPSTATFVQELAFSFKQLYRVWQQLGFDPIRALWMERVKGKGEPLTVRFADGKTVEGVFKELSVEGALILQSATQTYKVYSGEVFFREL